MSSVDRPASKRPLSPHLQVYRPQLTSILSITHRGTGMFLALGALYLVCWLLAIASGPDAYAAVSGFARTILGRLLLLGWTFSLFYHLGNGVRHLLWDAGKGLDLKTTYMSGWLVVIAAVVLTVIAWIAAYMVR